MDSTQQRFIKALFVFENTMNRELVRSLHVYGLNDDKEKQVEKEFLFKERGQYVEMQATPILKLRGFQVSEMFEGRVIGLWRCIFAFAAESSLTFINIPPILLISRNPKLKSIPTLANDLEMIFQLSRRTEDQELSQSTSKEACEMGTNDCSWSRGTPQVFHQDLNCLPYSVSTHENSGSQQIEQCGPGEKVSGTMEKKKKRAASEDVAKIDLEDLVKYFDLPILEASTRLNVGLTVLKKKCREFGIPRWPHRKIKSLDGLIHELQEVDQQQPDGEAVSTAVAKRREMLEEEKETIERKPFVKIQHETKKFRQDIFKRRHKAKALKKQTYQSPSSQRIQKL